MGGDMYKRKGNPGEERSYIPKGQRGDFYVKSYAMNDSRQDRLPLKSRSYRPVNRSNDAIASQRT
jgi:hypothetical protein